MSGNNIENFQRYQDAYDHFECAGSNLYWLAASYLYKYICKLIRSAASALIRTRKVIMLTVQRPMFKYHSPIELHMV